MRTVLTNEQLEEAKERYHKKESLKSIGKDFGCSAPTMSKILKNAGIEVRSRGRKPKTPIAQATKEKMAAANPPPSVASDEEEDLPQSTKDKLEAFKKKIVGS